MKENNKLKEVMGRLLKEEVVKTVLDLIQKDRYLTMDEVARRLRRNNRPEDTPPSSSNTTFDYSSIPLQSLNF